MPKLPVMSSTSPSPATSSLLDKTEAKPKVDPSFKSKRYRDKLRTEVKALEALLPVDRTSLSRKLDSQTVFRLVIAFLRTQGYFQALGFQTGQTEVTNENTDGYHGDAQDTQAINGLANGSSCLQVLDGFLLVLTADGTIFYVSSNVLQYLGYNQVDLMHRCLYSIVHNDDLLELKMIMETTLGHLLVHPPTQLDQNQDGGQNLEECTMAGSETCKPVSFICRMRCFSGSSIGYLKMDCSGKMVHLPSMLKSKRFSSNIVLLFCNPFMPGPAEITVDLHKNGFWSKHDLDLNIKEIDKKSADIIGFESDEVEKHSFYILIHPEDLAAVATCHKMLLESTEVQTVYFRLQVKSGEWLWLTSRGKVISKNSKKFSIAFSHCPLREEDSTYVQQEAVLRRRYAINDLMCLPQFEPTHHAKSQQADQRSYICTPMRSKKGESQRYNPYFAPKTDSKYTSNSASTYKGDTKKEDSTFMDISCVLDVMCPSAWHAMSDRHSPVLPSSHVAHKISQREKQMQFQEYCRRQHIEADSRGENARSSGIWDQHGYGEIPGNTTVSPITTENSCPLVQSTSYSGGRMTVAAPRAGDMTGILHEEAHPATGFGHYMAASHAGAPACIASWPGCATASSADPTGSACLTPSRSPLHARVSHAYGAFASQSFQPHVPAVYESSRAHGITCTNMPPSPPPSPPNSFLRHPPVYHYFQPEKTETSTVSYVGFCNYRPDWPSSHTCIAYPQIQSASCGDLYSALPAISTASCTIADLQKTAEKFLQLKEESSCDARSSGTAEDELRSHSSGLHSESNNIKSDWYCRPSWSYDGHLMPQRPVNGAPGSGLGLAKTYLPAVADESLSKHTSISLMYSDRPVMDSQIGQKVMSQYYAENYSTNVSSHYANFLAVPPSSTSFASAPSYPYPFYAQAGLHPRQYPMSRLYATQGTHVKVMDIQRPAVDQQPLDLPSIGSFLEYLNDV